jgi:hypothetical protein
MGYTSTNDPDFREQAARWIAERQEASGLIRFSHAAGSKSFEFFDSAAAFQARLQELPSRTCVTIFGERQLPLRGVVDDDFIRQASASIPDGTEYLVAGLELVQYGQATWYHYRSGETADDLRGDLDDMRGELVAVGPYPPWLEDDENVISAVVPNPDGTVTTGVY